MGAPNSKEHSCETYFNLIILSNLSVFLFALKQEVSFCG